MEFLGHKSVAGPHRLSEHHHNSGGRQDKTCHTSDRPTLSFFELSVRSFSSLLLRVFTPAGPRGNSDAFPQCTQGAAAETKQVLRHEQMVEVYLLQLTIFLSF